MPPDYEIYVQKAFVKNVADTVKAMDKVYRMKGGARYRCGTCKKDSNIKAETLMTDSPLPIKIWLYAIYLLMTAKKGISSLQLAKELITQKSAWFLRHRLREACGDDGNVKRHTLERLESLSRLLVGKSITYKKLIV